MAIEMLREVSVNRIPEFQVLKIVSLLLRSVMNICLPHRDYLNIPAVREEYCQL